MKGFRGTAVLSTLAQRLAVSLNVDYVFYDTGPNIGPLNRAILLDCDYFIVPAGCDVFSVRALRTLGKTLTKWISRWQAFDATTPDGASLLPGKPAFLGFAMQGFRVYSGGMVRRQNTKRSLRGVCCRTLLRPFVASTMTSRQALRLRRD